MTGEAPATGPAVTVELRDHVLHMGLNRPESLNAFDTGMLDDLAEAYGRLEDDPDAWVGVLFAHGEHFTSGLDLEQAAGRILGGESRYASPDAIDPWGVAGRPRTKPAVAAVQGWCLTLGIELVLRGIYPFGGATLRFPAQTEFLLDDVTALLLTADAAEGLASFLERRPAEFTGR